MSKTFNNWKVVLLSVIGATTFWFFNALNKDYDARISYPIEFEFEEENVVIMRPLASTIVVDVSSGGWNLLRKTFWFNVSPITIELDNPTEIGFYTRASLLPIVTDQLGELRINYLVSDTVFIDIQEKKSKEVALKIDSLAIPLAENHRITSVIDLSRDTVILTGPKSFIDTLEDSYPITVNIKGISNTFNRNVPIRVPNSDLIQSAPPEVRISFDVEKFERKSADVEVEPINFPADSTFFLTDNTLKIFYTVSEESREEFGGSDFAITADFKTFRKSDSTVATILIYYPEEALEIEVIPDRLKVTHVE